MRRWVETWQGGSLLKGPLSTPGSSSPKRVPLPALYPLEFLTIGEANTLFRSNSLATKSMESFLKVRLHGILLLFYR